VLVLRVLILIRKILKGKGLVGKIFNCFLFMHLLSTMSVFPTIKLGTVEC